MSAPEPSSQVPRSRITAVNRATPRRDGEFVLYWMIASRRTGWNFALQRAVDWARELDRPLVVLEALRAGHRWASDRFHRFVLEGMADNARSLADTGVQYYPYVEPRPGDGRGLLEELARRAAVVVTDDYPCFFLPRMVDAAARRCPVLLERVDSNGLLPVSVAPKVFPTAYAFRRFLQRELPGHLGDRPAAKPVRAGRRRAARGIPRSVRERWPAAKVERGPAALDRLIAEVAIDHSVPPVPRAGGNAAGARTLRRFVDERLRNYAEQRNQPDREAGSGLSPYLHFGHVSVHEVFHRLAHHEEWTPARLERGGSGKRSGFWGMSEPAESFLDELVTWRELGFNMCARVPGYDRWDSLPEWARRTLDDHESDEREHVYTTRRFAEARTHDPLWNAAQVQLVREGRIHNYLRMLWGKKILEWTRTPRQALRVMIELNNRYAVDGRDPNSYSGIFWVLGRYDRPWGPERAIFGKVRYMSSENTARKVRVRDYIERYRPEAVDRG